MVATKDKTTLELRASVLEVDFDAWRRQGVRLVCLDVDGTLTTYNGRAIDQAVLDHIKRAADQEMRFVLVTNNMFNRRLRRMQAAFGGEGVIERIYNPHYFFDRKPRLIFFRRLEKELGLTPQQIGVVGNNYLSDIWTAWRAGVGHIAWVRGYERRDILYRWLWLPLEEYFRRRVSK